MRQYPGVVAGRLVPRFRCSARAPPWRNPPKFTPGKLPWKNSWGSRGSQPVERLALPRRTSPRAPELWRIALMFYERSTAQTKDRPREAGAQNIAPLSGINMCSLGPCHRLHPLAGSKCTLRAPVIGCTLARGQNVLSGPPS